MPDEPLATPGRNYAIASLLLGILGLPTGGLCVVGTVAGIALGVIALVKANRGPAAGGGRALAVIGIVLSVLSLVVAPLMGYIATFVVPSVLRASRVGANERAAIADVRQVVAAEARYRSASGGSFGTFECLAAPAGCDPRIAAPALIDGGRTSHGLAHGYQHRFYPGPSRDPAGTPASGLRAYAYVAWPEVPYHDGDRSFCGDATGRLCAVQGGRELDAEGGACPADCTRLEGP